METLIFWATIVFFITYAFSVFTPKPWIRTVSAIAAILLGVLMLAGALL